MNDFSRYWKAINFIFSRHGEQKRKSANIPYVIHPIRVASILRSVGFSEQQDENLMIAALCHDLLEDTTTSFEEISQKFGDNVANIVSELSKPNSRNKDEWIESFKNKSKEAQIIKMADRIDNLKAHSSQPVYPALLLKLQGVLPLLWHQMPLGALRRDLLSSVQVHLCLRTYASQQSYERAMTQE